MNKISMEMQIYLCKYHDVDEHICFTTKLNRSQIEDTIQELKEKGLYEKYRRMSEEEYEKIIKDERRNKNKMKGTDIQEPKTIKEKEMQITDLENTYVTVSVKTVMEWSYHKGYLDRMLEEEKIRRSNGT